MESDTNAPAVAEQANALAPASNDSYSAKVLKKQQQMQLRALGKTFGHIPDVPVFSHWATRADCSGSAVHRALMAGICGSSRSGVYSVALSHLYKDDQDGGDVIFYTGAGGRERWTNAVPPKRLRVGPQTKDQSWENTSNQALQVSMRTGNPVRLIRSSRCRSKYAPLEGYRYDGLYKVAACWTAKGHNGMNICRCRLERLPDQPPIPLRPITMSASRRGGRLVSTPPFPLPSTQKESDAWGKSEESPNEPDVTNTQPAQRAALFEPGALPRYRWDPITHELVRIRPSGVILEAEEDEEEHRAEDDATLVPSEDGHAHANECMDTECEFVRL